MGRVVYVLLVVALLVFVMSMDATFAEGDGKGGGNGKGGGGGGDKGKGDGNGGDGGKKIGDGKDNGNGNGNGNGKGDNGGDGKKNGNGKGDNNGEGHGKGNGDGNGNGNGNGTGGGNGNGKGNGNGSAKGNGNGNADNSATNYKMIYPVSKTGQEQAECQGAGRCYLVTLKCPTQCTQRKPKDAKKSKGCFINCNKCETTCKFRKPNCEGYGSVCYDPRFVGGDGVMFYFHGAKGGDFALVSDDQLQINAHFIGTRPQGRTRDFTWVQALAVMFDSHTLVIASQKVTKWDDNVDALMVRWDGKDVVVPTDGEAEWRIMSDNVRGREVVVERTDATNSVRVTISGLMEMDVKVTPIGEVENRVHNYRLPEDDAFAHLETQFRFTDLTDMVEGVLGQTYRPNFISPVKIGVPMPTMGGEDKYRTLSFLSPQCAACRFEPQLPATVETDESGVIGVAQY